MAQVVQLLLNNIAIDINSKDIFNQTALHTACSSQNIECVELLLKNSNHLIEDINAKDGSDKTALDYCSSR